ncbi:methionine aminopeptidase, putative [Theileria equi strain WA]|uniref:Methionine aminopeptidase, putative n=1 Tax=Theileria equi strain WA TaxID=1537102 RepID=L1LBT0_THEEQ|nr:methionine aminopeptidase, putative [Theileria equi strain WA]EKX72729.1 methionine aminopeptidase, putative [Theileria equi strain WA]|eukprot:XP_004832181.1 methionine aminopeptidase, putative [Theileria equi strain WA]
MILKVFGQNGCTFALILAILSNIESIIALKYSSVGRFSQTLVGKHLLQPENGRYGASLNSAFIDTPRQLGLSPGRNAPVASQKHILEKERYIRKEGPVGFQRVKKKQENLDRTQRFKKELESKIPNVSIKSIWDHFNYTGGIRKGILSGKQYPSKHAKRPNYYKTGIPEYVPYPGKDRRKEDDPRGTLKTPSEIEGIRKACKIAREILDSVHDLIVEGVFTDDIDRRVHKMCEIKKVYPSPLNYNGFPKSVCVSVNEVMCHGIPDSTVLSAGDLVNVDVTVYVDGFHGDISETFIVLPAQKKLKPQKLMGDYERNKMNHHASFHNNMANIATHITAQQGITGSLSHLSRGIKPQQGWADMLERIKKYWQVNKDLFEINATPKNQEALRVGVRLANDVYDGRIVGLPSALFPTYISDLEGGKRFIDSEFPDITFNLLPKHDPDRYYKPYLFSPTFDSDVELMKITHDALMEVIKICRPGTKISKIGEFLTKYANDRGCNVYPNFFGHGIGRNFHEFPYISHVENDSNIKLQPGMVFTIEPIMVKSSNIGYTMWPDGWTIAACSGTKTAQFEHTILITDGEPEILTKRLPSSPPFYWENPIKVKY